MTFLRHICLPLQELSNNRYNNNKHNSFLQMFAINFIKMPVEMRNTDMHCNDNNDILFGSERSQNMSMSSMEGFVSDCVCKEKVVGKFRIRPPEPDPV